PATFRTPPAPYRERAYSLGPGFAASAASRFIASAGTKTCGMPVQTKTRYGIVLASSPGNSGMRRVAKHHSCGGCKGGAAAKPEDGYGRVLRLTTAFRSFGCGGNTGMCP